MAFPGLNKQLGKHIKLCIIVISFLRPYIKKRKENEVKKKGNHVISLKI